MPNLSRLQRQAYHCFQQGEFNKAERLCAAILEYRPDDFDALHLLGMLHFQRHRMVEALRFLARALKVNSASADALSNLGLALHATGRYDEAISSYRHALDLAPDHPEILYNLGNACLALDHVDDALSNYDHVLALAPGHVGALVNRGNALLRLNQPVEAMASYDNALAISPGHPQILTNRGHALRRLDRPVEALANFRAALVAGPEFAEAHFEAAMTRLSMGDFDAGWKEYEWRWKTGAFARHRPQPQAPLWLGDAPVAGKTILLHAEQGFGDTIQFCRYVPQVAERAAHVIVEVQKPLCALMKSLTGAAQIVPRGEALPDFDLHCPLLSLPLAFGTRLETIPSQTPYLTAPEHKMSVWRDRLSKHELGKQERPRVGLVWAGDPRKSLPGANRIDRQRSLQFDRLAPVLEVRDCDFYSLQKGEDAQAQLRSSALSHRITDWSADFHDFSDTAALIENLDLVIAVDTAIAHLAGALGKPLWLINRYNTCWRWLLDRDDSPWYPTARLFRQDETRDWHPVITRIAAALRDYVHSVE